MVPAEVIVASAMPIAFFGPWNEPVGIRSITGGSHTTRTVDVIRHVHVHQRRAATQSQAGKYILALWCFVTDHTEGFTDHVDRIHIQRVTG